MKCEHGIRKQTCSVCKPELVHREYARKAAKRHLAFQLTLSEFEEPVQDACHFCGEYPARGIDRKDNRIGYIPSNCIPCCGVCNFMKLKMEYHRFLAQVAKITRYQNLKANGFRPLTLETAAA